MPAPAPTQLRPTPPTAAQRDRLVVTVYGTPAPQGSKRYVGNGVMVESSKKVKPWRADVREAALSALAASPWWDPSTARVIMHVTFTLPRPLGHYRTKDGQRTALLHDWAPAYHASKPDLDKLVRSTCDALTSAGVYGDDSRVSQIIATKAYSAASVRLLGLGVLDRPGAHIVLTRAES